VSDRFAGRITSVPALVLLVCVLAFTAWRIVNDTMAHTLAASSPERALSWDSHNAAALLELAQQRMAEALLAPDQSAGQSIDQLSRNPSSKANLNEARELVERAVRFDILAPGAFTDLARIFDAQGDNHRAETLMELAGQRALRDPVAQGWLLEHALRRGNFAAALPHLDALLRTHSQVLDRSLPLVIALVSYPAAAGPLASLLATDPPWRAWFMSAVPPRVSNQAALARFYAELQAGPKPPTEKELQPYLDRLVKDGSYREAYDSWVKSLPLERRTRLGLLYNGNFADPTNGSEFDWKIRSQPGANIDVTGNFGNTDRTLLIEFSGARVDFRNVSHLLLLQPGRYQLSGEFEAESLRTERGLWWRLYCVENPEQTLAHTTLETQSGPWRPFSISFEVRPRGCRAQELRLELPARIAFETVISGSVSYRRMDIRTLQ
jgi:hypothetical protein